MKGMSQSNTISAIQILQSISNRILEKQSFEELTQQIVDLKNDFSFISEIQLYLYDYRKKAIRFFSSAQQSLEFINETEKNVNNSKAGNVIASQTFQIENQNIYIPIIQKQQCLGCLIFDITANKPIDNEILAFCNFICSIITDAYYRLQELEESKILASIARETDRAIIIANKLGKIEWVNEGFTQLSGYTLEEVFGKRPGDFLQGTISDPERVQKLGEALRKHERIETELYNYDKNGNPYWVNLEIKPVFENGELMHFISVQKDMTEEKNAKDNLIAAQSRLFALINNLQSGVVVEDEHRNVILLNQHFCDLFSLPKKDEVINHWKMNDVIKYAQNSVADIEKFTKDCDEIYQNKKITIHQELLLNNNRILERTFIPIYSKNTFVGCLWQYEDITNRKFAEQELSKAVDVAKTANDAKTTLLANTSHEIRTSMNVIFGMAKLLSETVLNEEQKKYLSGIKSSAENLLVVINDILDLSKIEAGKLKFENINFNLRKVMEDAVNFLSMKAEEKNISLQLDYDLAVNEQVIGDPYRLNQVFLNLLNNALKFTEEGSITLKCTLKEHTLKDITIKFEIIDTGIGIDETKLQSIFDSFTQENTSTTRTHGGTGLGLSISKQLVELMGGKLEAFSQKNVGSTFSFTLIFENGAKEESKIEKKTPSQESLQSMKLLLVEDNEFNRLMAENILIKCDIKPDIAVNGLEAVEKVREKQYDLILMDIQMPIMSGIEATQIIRNELKSNIPIIALTAHALAGEREKYMEVGMNEYLAKPFDANSLLYLIKLFYKMPIAPPTPNETKETEQKHDGVKLYNLNNLRKMSKDGDVFVMKMLEIFLKQTETISDDLKSLLQKDDFKEISSLVHQIKPSLQYMGVDSLYNIAVAIESEIKTNAERSTIVMNLDILCNTLPLLIQQLSKEYIELERKLH